MVKPAVTITSLVAGGALFAMLASIKLDPLGLTSLANGVPGDAASGLQSTADSAAPLRIELPEIQIAASTDERANSSAGVSAVLEGSRKAIDRVASVRAPAKSGVDGPERQWVPCSPWRDLGPKLSKLNDAAVPRSVRQLC